MDSDLAARRLAELGNPTRLAIYRLLVQAGRDGASVGEIGRRMEVPPSTLNFHLRGLVQAGLVDQAKAGRTVTCRAVHAALDEVVAFLKRECCAGLPEEADGSWRRGAG